MTTLDLRMLYKRETGRNPFMTTKYRQTKPTDDYRAFIEYVNWLEELAIDHIELKKRLIPWESSFLSKILKLNNTRL